MYQANHGKSKHVKGAPRQVKSCQGSTTATSLASARALSMANQVKSSQALKGGASTRPLSSAGAADKVMGNVWEA